jgi:hypothetical protein
MGEVRRFRVGGLCPRGGSHVWLITDEDAGACGSKSWDLFIEVEDEDVPYLLEEMSWLKGAEVRPAATYPEELDFANVDLDPDAPPIEEQLEYMRQHRPQPQGDLSE